LRHSIGTSVVGDSLVQVAATTGLPELSHRLADATVATYIDYVARASVEEGTTTEDKTSALVSKADDERKQANQRVKDFLTAHPDAVGTDAPPVLAQDLVLLQSDFQRAEERYSQARAAQDQADLKAGTASDVVRQQLVLLVPSTASVSPEPVLRGAILTVALFAALGALLALASAVLSATLDRTIREPQDVRARFGLDVAAVVPDVAR
jgi:uncharacterized protein involved in exopolysaccharide biosynthesis